MAQAYDLEEVLGTVTFLEGRTRHTDTKGTFARVADYRDGGIFTGGFSGTSAWEKHPAEEVLQVIDGAATLSLITETGREDHEITTGDLVVVPTGHWHRFHAPKGITLLSVTPQPTDHFTGDGEPET